METQIHRELMMFLILLSQVADIKQFMSDVAVDCRRARRFA